ncbi:hypothetical protein [Micromonospora sp. D93]|uniref:hypothetical protein n=1 Tax=Micromonospora sp. D93 TaxID=2824886 RepID=UPI001FFDCA97|nr:hypothetical protein [Micromonospora sp. D93]
MFDLALHGCARPLVRPTIGTTPDDYQVNVAPSYPAHAPAADKWIKKQESTGYYATDLQPAAKAGTEYWSGWGSGVFSQERVIRSS